MDASCGFHSDWKHKKNGRTWRVHLVPDGTQPQLKMLDASSEIQQTLFATLAFTGMRSGELRTLRREDIDLKNNWIYINSRDGAPI